MSNTPIQALQSRLGYHFASPDLMCQALTHRSAGPANYERLEHLGDAVLDLAVTVWLYRDFPYFGPGQMSILRAELVCAETLARLARQLDLPMALRLSPRADLRGFRQRVAILSDVFEAVVGAIFVDSGDLAAVQAALLPLIKPLADAAIDRDPDFYPLTPPEPELDPAAQEMEPCEPVFVGEAGR